MTDTAPVLDPNGVLTDQYRNAVAAALPAGVSPPDEFWRDLAGAIGTFLSLQQHRTDRPAKLELKRWQNIDRLVSELADELCTIRRTRWSDSDFDQGAPEVALAALWRIKRMAEAGTLGHRMIGASFRARNNPYRQILYGNVLDLWRRRLGQGLGFSRSDQGPHGPLIRFLCACIGPVLGDDTPTASGFASIIDRERKKLRIFAGAGVGAAVGTSAATGRATSVFATEK